MERLFKTRLEYLTNKENNPPNGFTGMMPVDDYEKSFLEAIDRCWDDREDLVNILKALSKMQQTVSCQLELLHKKEDELLNE